MNPAFQITFKGGQVVYENVDASMVTLQDQFQATQTRTESALRSRCVACRSNQDDDEVDEVTQCAGVGCDNGLHLFCGQRGSAWCHETGQSSRWTCASCTTRGTLLERINSFNTIFKAREVLRGNLIEDRPHGSTSPTTRYSTSRLPLITDDSANQLPDLVYSSDDDLPDLVDGHAGGRTISHVYMVVSDLPDQRIHVQMNKGVLDPNLHDVCQAIGHVVNCVELRPCGLAAGVQQSFPYGDVYANRKPSHHEPTIAGFGAGRPGRIEVRTPAIRGQPIVVNMYAQWRGGNPTEASTVDAAENRLEYFRRCLEGVANYVPAISSIAFPENVGCGLGGGDHQAYDLALRNFAGEHPEIRVMMVAWRDRSVTISNLVGSMRACTRQPAPVTHQGRQGHGASTGAAVLIDTCGPAHMPSSMGNRATTGRSNGAEALRADSRQQAPACQYGDYCRARQSARGCPYHHAAPPTVTPARCVADNGHGGRADSSQGDSRRQQAQSMHLPEAAVPRQQCDFGPQCMYLRSANGCKKHHPAADRAEATSASRAVAQATGPSLPYASRLEVAPRHPGWACEQRPIRAGRASLSTAVRATYPRR